MIAEASAVAMEMGILVSTTAFPEKMPYWVATVT